MNRIHNGNGHANGHHSLLQAPSVPATHALADRLPPQNLEAERSVLGSCMLDASVIDDVTELVKHTDFYRSTHEEVFQAIVSIHGFGLPVDCISVSDHLKRVGRFYAIGGNDLLTEIIEQVPHAANARYYAGIVREKAIMRKAIEACTDVIRAAYSHDHTASELLCLMEERVLSVGNDDQEEVVYEISQSVAETMTRFNIRRTEGMTGLSSGYLELDDFTGGFQPGEMTIVAGRPGSGKTACAWNIAANVASGGQGVLFVSLEMGRTSLGDRILSSQARVDTWHFQRPAAMSEEMHRRVIAAAHHLSGLPIHLDFTVGRGVLDIGACARRINRKRPLSLVVVDYASLIEHRSQHGRSRENEVAEVSKGLKNVSRRLNLPLILVCQLNRLVENREDHRPRMSDLRESGQFEQDAVAILLLHRPEYYNPDDQPGVAELIVAKNRNGRTGTVKLKFVKECTRFDPWSEAVIAEGAPY